jgi:hypothetical protein
MRKPLTQGDEDGFCGLYSIVNALSLLFPGAMNDDERSRVFKAIAKSLVEWPNVIWEGTTTEDIRTMLAAASHALKNSFSWQQPFAHRTFPGFDEFRQELKLRIEGDNAFGIVGLSKPWSHWTCAHRLTDHEMIMTDSCHVKEIPLDKCGLAGDGTEYEFDHRQTFTLMKPSHGEHHGRN